MMNHPDLKFENTYFQTEGCTKKLDTENDECGTTVQLEYNITESLMFECTRANQSSICQNVKYTFQKVTS